MTEITNKILHASALTELIGGETYRLNHIGYVYSMSFTEAYVLTNDAWKAKVGGIPHNSFLLAASFNPLKFAEADPFEQEIVLLRVLGPHPLPTESEIVRAKIEHNQMKTSEEIFSDDKLDGLDPITLNEFQFGALRCRILGTFYEEEGQLRLGSDIENYMSSTRLRVFKPRGNALEKIINHINPDIKSKALQEAKKAGFTALPTPIKIGTVRYTSTARLHRAKTEPLIPVMIQPSDFLSRRTAVFGMTRTGKSNTVKTMVAAVALAAMKDKIKVGQIIFDINGEYANANHQDDGSSIAEVFINDCVRYRAVETNGFEDLRLNFYLNPDQALYLIQSLFKSDNSPYGGQDLDIFMSTSLEEPDISARSEYVRWERWVAVFQAILKIAGYEPPKNFKIRVPRSTHLLRQMKEVFDDLEEPESDFVDPDVAIGWFLKIREANLRLKAKQKEENKVQIGLESSTKGNAWVDATLEAFLNILARENSRGVAIGGWRAIVNFRPYHSSRRTKDVIDEIVSHLEDGKIVILDLSAGPVEVRTVLSERIARKIFENSFEKMNRGEIPQNIVIYIEEAHNLIGKNDELNQTWPRIAKEGAKAKIALVYSTQEPSSVHPNILANTENWFVTHLNNEDELKALGKFYDFKDFHDSLKTAQDVGFARIKTLSSPFVVPTQIDRFTPEKIKAKIQKIKGKLI